uniref:Obg-like ATPase homolog n=1 Tax=Dermatophagoides pteronyssinus TaxID=6956 RepID=A0A6P6Y4L1_DERPT|nr:obg-like ATPase 1 [Dermatophagoides pteronyssinus]
MKRENRGGAPLLGRFKGNVKIGLIGLPNVGKSSTFNLLSKQSVPAENYPFCTINPNEAKVHVHDARFDHLCKMYQPKSQVPSSMTVVDIAGLVEGAHKGEGLGNAFLSHIQRVDALFHVVRAFDAADVTHVCGDVCPVRELEIISSELRFKDLEKANALKAELERVIARGQGKSLKTNLEVIEKVIELLEQKKWIASYDDWSAQDCEVLNEQCFLTAKQLVYLVNVSERDFLRKKNKYLPKIAEWTQNNLPGPVIPYSVEYEEKLLTGAPDATTPSRLNAVISAGYAALNLIHFFTVGADEVRSWDIRRGMKAPQAAGMIHTDMERGFICADVTKYEDLVEQGSEAAAKAAGKVATRGRTYTVEDGDIMFFKFNPSGGKKK